eukprot:TRINITY_DN22922_c0_g1_i2.p2 TRINITY_DN22922_c0_g1~~TRINITY_DN22922_c0_g1_i2.p2  ORF type:complete len:101 (-),score=4.06 TRINITY_DN22922_c0_g1_i2:352-654(-)
MVHRLHHVNGLLGVASSSFTDRNKAQPLQEKVKLAHTTTNLLDHLLQRSNMKCFYHLVLVGEASGSTPEPQRRQEAHEFSYHLPNSNSCRGALKKWTCKR